MFVEGGSTRLDSRRAAAITADARPVVRGKFLEVDGEKLWIRGVTYGPFGPAGTQREYGSAEQVERDFRRMADNGLNAVRLYTVPPRWLLDLAHRHGLWVMVGIAWEQHVTFLSDKPRRARIDTCCSARPA